jgi:glutamyl-tRNA(Gln) amidotransferase subunit E
MYPDTDLPPRRITREHLGRIAKRLPHPLWESERWYREISVPEDLIPPLCISPYSGLFEVAVKEWHISPTLAAVTLIQYPKRIAKKRGGPAEFSEQTLKEILLAYKENVLAKEGILPVLLQVAAGSAFSRDALPGSCSDTEFLTLVGKAEEDVSAMRLHNPENRTAVLLGLVMQRVRGRVDGGEVARRLGRGQKEARA